jgi:hypothetical protein
VFSKGSKVKNEGISEVADEARYRLSRLVKDGETKGSEISSALARTTGRRK